MSRRNIIAILGPTSFALYLLVLVALPLLAVVFVALREGLSGLQDVLNSRTAVASLNLTAVTCLIVGVINLVFGTMTAWVLVQYRFWGRALISSVIDLPLALPTLVAGVLIAILYGPTGIIGPFLEENGLTILFTPTAIVLALSFVTAPFVVRAVEPVLLEIDPAEVAAARMLGAKPWKIFKTVYLPAILPSAISSTSRSMGRALGEFGSLVVVSGNIPLKTLAAPAYIFGEIEAGAPLNAAVLSSLLFASALSLYALSILVTRKFENS